MPDFWTINRITLVLSPWSHFTSPKAPWRMVDLLRAYFPNDNRRPRRGVTVEVTSIVPWSKGAEKWEMDDSKVIPPLITRNLKTLEVILTVKTNVVWIVDYKSLKWWYFRFKTIEMAFRLPGWKNWISKPPIVHLHLQVGKKQFPSN